MSNITTAREFLAMKLRTAAVLLDAAAETTPKFITGDVETAARTCRAVAKIAEDRGFNVNDVRRHLASCLAQTSMLLATVPKGKATSDIVDAMVSTETGAGRFYAAARFIPTA